MLTSWHRYGDITFCVVKEEHLKNVKYSRYQFRIHHENLISQLLVFRPCGKESTEVRKSQIKGKESENSYQELKRSQKDRHTQTHENCIEIFRLARPSFSIGRE